MTSILNRLQSARAKRVSYRRTLSELTHMNDASLVDLGLSRVDLPKVAHDAVYGN